MNAMQAPNVGPAGRDFGNKERPAFEAPTARPGYVWCRCMCCGDPFEARKADRKRGWGRFCSKSCKAVKQEQRTGQYRDFLLRGGLYGRDDDRQMFPSHAEGDVQ